MSSAETRGPEDGSTPETNQEVRGGRSPRRIPRRPLLIAAGLGLMGIAAAAWLSGSLDRWREPSQAGKEAGHAPARAEDEHAGGDLPRSTEPGTVVVTARQQEAISLRTATVSSGKDRHVVTAPGKVAPDETQFAYITPRAPGVVRSVAAHIGQAVKAGDLLATIDSPIVGDARLELYTRLQTLEIAGAQADWQATIYQNTLDLVSRLKQNETPQQIHEAFTNRAVGENRERLLTAYAQFRLAVATLERNRELYSQNLITPKQFQQVTADYEVAQATYQSLMDQMGFETRLAKRRADQARRQAEAAVRAAQERLRILGVKPDGTEPEIRSGRVLGVKPDGTLPAASRGSAPVDETPETVLPTDKEHGAVAVDPLGSPAESTISMADAPVSRISIWAPFDGIILDRELIVPGVSVDPTSRIFTLANLATVYVEVNIHEQDFAALPRSQGGTVKLRSPAYPGRDFEGEVIYAGDLVDEASRTVKLLARARNPERLLKPGMFVTAELLSAQGAATLEVPASAVLSQGRGHFVMIRTGPETFARRDIKLVEIRGDRALIAEGLGPEDRVVSEGASKLKGMLVGSPDSEP